MIASIDVDYRGDRALAACLLFRGWTDAVSQAQLTETIAHVEPYHPGQFYRRELPCLLQVLGKVADPPNVVVIDGYVWLADESRPGLGGHLYEALGRKVAVVGVAKTHFRSAHASRALLRGGSSRPLYVTAAGMEVDAACRHVQAMHGAFRIPTLLQQVDQLSRTAGA
jgi:deoxyribonuclease V